MLNEMFSEINVIFFFVLWIFLFQNDTQFKKNIWYLFNISNNLIEFKFVWFVSKQEAELRLLFCMK